MWKAMSRDQRTVLVVGRPRPSTPAPRAGVQHRALTLLSSKHQRRQIESRRAVVEREMGELVRLGFGYVFCKAYQNVRLKAKLTKMSANAPI
jgi:hypothetical protein